MNWITLTYKNLETYQAGALVKAMQTAALGEDQSCPVAAAINVTILKIRSAIKSGGFSVDKDTSKIPAELEYDALAMIVALAKPRLLMALKTDEKSANEQALALLDKIASGSFSPSLPDDPESSSATTQSSGGVSLVNPSRNVPSSNDFRGL